MQASLITRVSQVPFNKFIAFPWQLTGKIEDQMLAMSLKHP